MTELRDLALQELTWEDIRKDVKTVNRTFFDIIEALSPSSHYKFYKAIFNYGDEILRDGQWMLKHRNGSWIPFKHPDVPKKIKSALGYNFGTNPVALVLENTLEFFLSFADRVIPFAIVSPGKIIGLTRALEPNISFCPETFLWGLSAGARSIFMLPKIASGSSHNRLRKSIGIRADKPKDLRAHWPIFVEIVNSERCKCDWQSQLVYFSAPWFAHKNDPAWLAYNNYLIQTAWQSNAFWRNQYLWSLVFSSNLLDKSVALSPFITNFVKHLFIIGAGVLPGLQPALDETLAPIRCIQQAYLEAYGMKQYLPTIMQPAYFSMGESSRSVYASLQYPTAIDYATSTDSRASTLLDLYNAGGLIQRYIQDMRKQQFNIDKTPFLELIEQAQFKLFHHNVSGYQEVNEAATLIDKDEAFKQTLATTQNKMFAKNSQFLSGCIQISKRDDTDI